MWRYLKIVSPQLLLNKITEVDVKNYSWHYSLAGTEAD
jgi:hypothetical protein